jgi:hypothetical protein
MSDNATLLQSQSKIFLDSEGDAWFDRNKDKLNLQCSFYSTL